WDRYHGGTEDSSCWIRVSQGWAGAGFGHLAIPRVGQEVIVDFLNGDPDQPIVMGRTYHEFNGSPGNLPGTKTQMTLRSKTYQGSGFNELRFDDATSAEQLYLHAQKNMDTEVLNNRTTDVKVDHSETIGNNQSITVGLGQTVKVGQENAGGHDQKITVAHDQSVILGNDQTLEVTHNRNKSVGNDQDSKVTGNDTQKVEQSQEITIGKDYTLTVTDSLTIKVGECLLKMNKDGTIMLNGVKIQFKAESSIKGIASDIHFN
ncbi:MAG TPA: type VI secretion system tip protein TssI/VgrG, partial [Buttiauxella sp.]|nr:type VI secretion system tip protein TssI/VgrG [Buttiauxella sp.]